MSAADSSSSSSTLTSPPPVTQLWILGPWADLLLFVGTPLLILPVLGLAQARWAADDIYLFVASFGAVGHHLPGMIRAYGDRDLFERFRLRFLLSPLFLIVVCLAFTLQEMSGIVLAVYLWGVWHGLMQTYGFLRIYDSKVKSFENWTSRLDRAMCFAWFGGAVVLSPTRMQNVLNTFYKAGGPLVSGEWIGLLRGFAAVAVALVTIAFLAHTVWLWRTGRRVSPIKLLLMGTSFGFWWYSNVMVANMLVGIALFEIFHDVQYLSIVWIYNRKRADQAGDRLAGFASFLFRRSGALVGVYVGLVLAYGSTNLLAQGLPSETLKRTLVGVLLASTLLHFYYDGFIWKVREKSTRKSLGLEGGKTDEAPGWLLHGLRWSLFLVPLVYLGVAEARGGAPAIDRAQAIAEALPTHAAAQYNLGVELAAVGDLEAAQIQYERALGIDPALADAHYNLGNLFFRNGNLSTAVDHYRRAVDLEPAAGALFNLGNALYQQGRTDEAIEALRQAIALQPELAEVRHNLGVMLASRGELESAASELERAVALKPEYGQAHESLADVLADLGRADESATHRERALALRVGEARR